MGVIRQHDIRDWAQRQPHCHDYLRRRRDLFTDYFWQCHGDLRLRRGPPVMIESRLANNPFYRFLERTWMLQQAPAAIGLYALGGWSFVVWGVAARVAVSVTGHWLVGYFAHHHDGADKNARMTWRATRAGVQGRNVSIAGFMSMGESWHNNHHAFPALAKIGLEEGQPDPGWWLIRLLETLGLAWSVRTPKRTARPDGLVRLVEGSPQGWRIYALRKALWKRLLAAG